MVRQATNDLPSKPVLLINEPDFRLVEVVIGTDVEHVLEVKDGRDAMGVERWRKFETSSTHLRQIFGYLTRIAIQLKQEQVT
jgi:hypothetical protein